MTQVLVTEGYLQDAADAIRAKLGTQDTYSPAQFAYAIGEIPAASDVRLGAKSVTANGNYQATSDSLDGYSSVAVNVPNSYSASDEGKVVQSGDLMAQTSTTKTANGTYDTTANNEVVVNVPNSYGESDEGKVVSGGELVTQTSRTVTENGTYDTTGNSEVVVNVSGGGSGGGSSFTHGYAESSIDVHRLSRFKSAAIGVLA